MSESKQNENDKLEKSVVEEKMSADTKRMTTSSDMFFWDENNYSIYNYFRKTPSMLIASVSGMMAFFSAIINYATYLQNARELRLWNIDPAIISSSDKHIFYSLCLSAIFIFLSVFVSTILCDITFNFKPFHELLYRLKLQMSEVSREVKSGIKRMKKIKSLIEKKQKENNNEENQIYKSQLTEIEKSTLKIKKEFSERKKDIKKCKREYGKIIRVDLIISFIFLIILDSFFLSVNVYTNIWVNLLRIVIISVIQLVFYYLLGLFFTKISIRIAVKHYPDHDQAFKEKKDSLYRIESPIRKIKKHGIKSLFSNQALLTVFISAVLLIFTIFIYTFLPVGIEHKKNAKCITINEVKYVAVFTNSEIMVLEEAEINEKNIRIYTSKQMIVPINDVKYEIINFESIERIEQSDMDSPK